jgi:hypothetical protein
MDTHYFEDGTEDGDGRRTRIITPSGTYDVTHLMEHARREALEEAAKLCDGLECPPFADTEWGEGAHACAEAIRALISPEPS